MADGEIDNLADLMFIHAAFNRWDDRNVQADFGQPVESSQFFVENIRLASKDAIRLRVEAIELEVERRPDLIQLFEEEVVLGDPFPLVLIMTNGMLRAFAACTKSMICG